MKSLFEVSPHLLAEYLLSTGWSRVPDEDNPAGFAYRMDRAGKKPAFLRLPSSELDENEANFLLSYAVEQLSKLENQETLSIVRTVSTLATRGRLRPDEISFSSNLNRNQDQTLGMGIRALETFLTGCRKALAYAAFSVKRRAPEYAGSALPAIVEDFLRRVVVGHTRPGSYVVPILAPLFQPTGENSVEAEPDCPYLAEEFQNPVYRTSTFGRKVTLTLHSALDFLHQLPLILEDSDSDETLKSGVALGVSAEMCEAVLTILSEATVDKVAINFRWSLDELPPQLASNSVSFSRAHVEPLKAAVISYRRRTDIIDYRLVGEVVGFNAPPSTKSPRIRVFAKFPGGECRSVWIAISEEDCRTGALAYTRGKPISVVGTLTRDKEMRPTILDARNLTILDSPKQLELDLG